MELGIEKTTPFFGRVFFLVDPCDFHWNRENHSYLYDNSQKHLCQLKQPELLEFPNPLSFGLENVFHYRLRW
jgi:hypothetical protein